MPQDPFARDSEQRIGDAAAERRERRQERERSQSRVSLRSLLLGAATRGQPITIETVAGLVRSVVVVEVGDDAIVATMNGTGRIIMRLRWVASVSFGAGVVSTDGVQAHDIAPREDRVMTALITEWLSPGTDISAKSGASQVMGRLLTVGADVVAVETTTATIYLSVDSLVEVSSTSSS